MNALNRPAFISFYERECLLHLYQMQVLTHLLLATCTLTRSSYAFLSWQQKYKEFLTKKSFHNMVMHNPTINIFYVHASNAASNWLVKKVTINYC